MRAFVVTGPGRSQVAEVCEPVPAPGQVVVDIERVGVCGTDVEFFIGEMAYLHQGHAEYPMRASQKWETCSRAGAPPGPAPGRRSTSIPGPEPGPGP